MGIFWHFALVFHLQVFMVQLKLSVYVLFSLYSIAECFAFLVCTKWSNPMIHRNSQVRETSSSSNTVRYLDWNSGLMVTSENHTQDRLCCLQDIVGHMMKIPIIGFQLLLCMHLEVVNDFVWIQIQ